MADMLTNEIHDVFEWVIERMKWEEVVSTLLEVIEAELGTAPPAEIPTANLSLAGPQFLPNMECCSPLAPGSTQIQGQEASAPVVTLFPVYYVLPPSTAAQVHQGPAAPLSSCTSAKNQDGHIKKPPNAFMLFLKEQRAKVKAELNIENSSALNKVLGERWTSLSPEEKEKYFTQALQERRMHEERHPGWSSAQNYGKKRKRKRAAAAAVGDEESAPGELNQAKRSRYWPADSGSAPPNQ